MRRFSVSTGLPAAFFFVLMAAIPAYSQTPTQNGAGLVATLAEISDGDFVAAARLAARNQDPIAKEIVEWYRLRETDADFADYEAFLAVNGDWPGLDRLRYVGETQIPTNVSPQRVIAFFNGSEPQSGYGGLMLAKALRATGQADAANAEIIRVWTRYALSPEEQSAILAEFSATLRPFHEERLDMLIWRQRLNEAQRMFSLVSAEAVKLAEVRIALQRQQNGVDAMISALPATLRNDAGLAFDRFRWRREKGYWDSAQEMMVERSSSLEALGRPEYWSDQRRTYARRAMRLGDHQTAYLLASQHFLLPGSDDYKDLEWLAGFIALRKLNDPQRALIHFQKFRAAVDSPISVGRAGYWLGRTYEALGDQANALTFYSLAATYQTSFYGQLAAERGGLPSDASLIGPSVPADWTRQQFLASDSVRAALLFHNAGRDDLTRWFLVHASETMTVPERAAVAQLAFDMDLPNTALKIAKEAALSGIVIPEAYYPLTDLSRFDSPVAPEYQMAIARQESEFQHDAASPVGALGLMQVMPATARNVAKGLGISYSQDRLANDWEYNATLGTAYLDEMLRRYSGSIILAAAAYNAGPHRADRWIRDYGDPRSPNVDAVDWIETIPFNETRNYVMRIAESVYVYRTRISGQVQPLTLSRDLKLGGGS